MVTKVTYLRQVPLGDGVPKTCVPLTAKALNQVIPQLVPLIAAKPDLIEWRLDDLEDLSEMTQLLTTLQQVRQQLGELPLLVTFRSQAEGGNGSLSSAAYQNLVQQLIHSGCIDAVDIELSRGGYVADLCELARLAGVVTVVSAHDFKQTPSVVALVTLLQQMAQQGAAVVKVAVMPQSAQDVLNLLQATLTAKQQLEQPMITMAMGKLGQITRLAGSTFGSAVTFATVTASSAPGQLPLAVLQQLLPLLAVDQD
ncbi:type I 3-dehydroquinate dehydratase [Loigolactobacillus jiayinensis]|uniref:3-dehydroquinate dehydratase n=1 Tax=Loigolactobacillus jiayinensis TaxID=2486016 RepID=A0ABW1RDY0_9LACO|nr:type I 3-dehydroquinate dehydratase [Loigolactobacillus jiayinensis]